MNPAIKSQLLAMTLCCIQCEAVVVEDVQRSYAQHIHAQPTYIQHTLAPLACKPEASMRCATKHPNHFPSTLHPVTLHSFSL